MIEESKYKVFLSKKASEQIKIKLNERKTPDAYVRLGVIGGKCAGYSYLLRFEDTISDKDIIFIIDDIKIAVDKKSILYLNNTTLDWEKTLMYQGFKFLNPMESSKCGCGQSVSFKDKI